MKLLLFGGTFDPPHLGHMSILKNAIAAVKPDEVWVMPAGTPPHKSASGTSADVRLAMCECFKSLFPGLIVSDIELCREGKSYTWDTVRQIMAQRPGAEIFLCIGSDMLLTFEEWRSWRELLQTVTLVVQNRRQQDEQPARAVAQALRGLGGRVQFAGGVVRKVSSSEVRAAAAQGKNLQGMVAPQVDEIIKNRHLYRGDESQ